MSPPLQETKPIEKMQRSAVKSLINQSQLTERQGKVIIDKNQQNSIVVLPPMLDIIEY
ncbi:MAG: hypothetical protein WCY88_09060 [Spongiibacteraceae bacterium]